ncbi:MAG TPA: ureidoglycolate lyase, partial [Bryobacteraceae bacterium]|nr:ureidoglycolate lyase [Bryobacteraceae bacterium]
MKLLRFGDLGRERPGILDSESQIRDLSQIVGDLGGNVLLPESLQKLRELNLHSLPLIPDGVRIGACVASVRKFICIGLNYADHAAESG